jgi:hypothetical protein
MGNQPNNLLCGGARKPASRATRATMRIDALPDAFDELWRAVGNGERIIIRGQVDGLPYKYSYIPAPSPYVWDVEAEDNAQNLF